MNFIHQDPEFPELLAIVQRHIADKGLALPFAAFGCQDGNGGEWKDLSSF